MPRTTEADIREGNGSEELAHSLIAPTHSKNATPPYAFTVTDEKCDSTYSVDNLRFRLRLRPHDVERFQVAMDTWTEAENVSYRTSNQIGHFYMTWTFYFKDMHKDTESSITVGVGLVKGSGKIDTSTGYVDGNPNKTEKHLHKLLDRLIGLGAKVEVIRYDLAIDFKRKRDMLRLVKDGRRYDCVISNAYTEYLGQRSTAGYCKLYDKAAESQLPEPLTRVELTAAAEWSAEEVVAKLPKVFAYDGVEFDGLRGVTKAFAVSVLAHVEKGDSAEPWLVMVDARTKAKLRKVFAADVALTYSEECVQAILDHVAEWAR